MKFMHNKIEKKLLMAPFTLLKRLKSIKHFGVIKWLQDTTSILNTTDNRRVSAGYVFIALETCKRQVTELFKARVAEALLWITPILFYYLTDDYLYDINFSVQLIDCIRYIKRRYINS